MSEEAGGQQDHQQAKVRHQMLAYGCSAPRDWEQLGEHDNTTPDYADYGC